MMGGDWELEFKTFEGWPMGLHLSKTFLTHVRVLYVIVKMYCWLTFPMCTCHVWGGV